MKVVECRDEDCAEIYAASFNFCPMCGQPRERNRVQEVVVKVLIIIGVIVLFWLILHYDSSYSPIDEGVTHFDPRFG